MFKIFLIFILIILDFFIKKIIFYTVNLNDFVMITSFFDLAHIHNFGVSFGLFSGTFSYLFFVIVALLLTAVVILMYFKSKKNLEKWGLIAIIAGALANIIDRFFNGYVIDYLYFHVGNFYWPAFNFADIYITIGVLIIILQFFKDFNNRVHK